MNYLAELNTVHLDSLDTLQTNWQQQFAMMPQDFAWTGRNYLQLNEFTDYFQNLFQTVISEIGLPNGALILQHHNKEFNCNKTMFVGHIHRDVTRKCCVTIPLTPIIEPLCFHNNVKTHTPSIKTSRYSHQHPMLVNVSEPHRVLAVSDKLERILLQIDYDIPFDEVIAHRPSIWNLV